MQNDNRVEREWGEFKTVPNLLHHHELLEMIGGFDPVKGTPALPNKCGFFAVSRLHAGTEVAGHRGYYLTGMGVALNQAIIQFGLQFLAKRAYQLVQTPFMMRKEIMARVAQLSQFDEELYKVRGTIPPPPRV